MPVVEIFVSSAGVFLEAQKLRGEQKFTPSKNSSLQKCAIPDTNILT